MSVLDTADPDLAKLHRQVTLSAQEAGLKLPGAGADHNMNSPAPALLHRAPALFPRFPFPFPAAGSAASALPTVPLSLQLTGALATAGDTQASPRSGESEESPKSSPTGQ